jgi:hypothetical protein
MTPLMTPAAEEQLPDRQRGDRAAHAIYGSIIVLAVIIAENDTAVSAGEAIGSVIGAASVTALAQLYADYIGATIRSHRHPTEPEQRATIGNVLAGFATAVLPVGFLILAAVGAMDLDVAFDCAVWTGVAVLGAFALVANRLAGFSIGRSVLVGTGFTLLGAFLVLLKTVL